MFGYVLTDREQLSEAEQIRYRSVYCGLCETLHEKYGVYGQMTLNFDMTFLTLLLSALYEPKSECHEKRCFVHPMKKRLRLRSEILDYTADMSVLLAYYNAMDDWHDDKKRKALWFAGKLRPYAEKISQRYPRQQTAITENLEYMNELERRQEINLDATANCFGKLLGELFIIKEDIWSEKLRALGEGLGKFIYFMDAYEDARKDEKHKNYNPLLQIKGEDNYETTCRNILTMFLGDASTAFEALPIVEDAHILRNILYAGVWTKYNLLEKKK